MKKEQPKIKCEKCNGEFEMGSIKLDKKNLGEGIEEIFFNCPLCGEFFTVIKTNLQIRELFKKNNYLKEKALKDGRQFLNDKELKIFKDRQLEIKRLSDELNNKAEVVMSDIQ